MSAPMASETRSALRASRLISAWSQPPVNPAAQHGADLVAVQAVVCPPNTASRCSVHYATYWRRSSL